MASEKEDDLEELLEEETADSPEPPPPEPPPPEEVPAEEPYVEADADPQEMWIEEYEREGRPGKPEKERKKPRHIGRWIVLAVVVIVLVVWTLISPPVMTSVGDTYLTGDHANLGNYSAEHEVDIIASLVTAGTATWGMSISGETNATVGEDTVFEVMVTKVSEEAGGFWFMGTEISLRNVSLYLEDDTLIGWMTEKDELRDMSVGYVHATFEETGPQDCYVVIRFSVYEVMRIGFLPADKVVATIDLSESIVVSGGP